MPIDPAALDEMRHDRFVDAPRTAHVEVFDAGGLPERSEPQSCCQLLGITFGCLAIHEQTEALFKAQTVEHVTGATLFVQRLGHAHEAHSLKAFRCGMCQQGIFLFLVVVILAPDVGMLQGKLFGFGLQKGLIEAGLQNGSNRRHGTRLDGDTTLTGRIKACRLIAFSQ